MLRLGARSRRVLLKPGSKLLQSVSGGWPLVLASLKSLLETGEPLEATSRWVAC